MLQFTNCIFSLILKNETQAPPYKISTFRTIRGITTNSSFNNLKHPKLNKEEKNDGCKLGLDTWVGTGYSGKYAYLEEFLIGKTVTAMGFSFSLGKLGNLPYAHMLYAYDHEDGSVLLLEYNNTIYLGDAMQDSLLNPRQSEEISVRIDLQNIMTARMVKQIVLPFQMALHYQSSMKEC